MGFGIRELGVGNWESGEEGTKGQGTKGFENKACPEIGHWVWVPQFGRLCEKTDEGHSNLRENLNFFNLFSSTRVFLVSKSKYMSFLRKCVTDVNIPKPF